MRRDNDRSIFTLWHDTSDVADIIVGRFSIERPIKIFAVGLVGGNPASTDADTYALDVSYSTDGFSSSDVEVAALAAAEYNDTDDTGSIGTRTRFDVSLTAASLDGDGVSVRVPASAVVEVTSTWNGTVGDGEVQVVVEYVVM